MPIYTVQGPDGRTYEIEGPAETSPQPSLQSVASEAGKVLDQSFRGGILGLPNLIATIGPKAAAAMREGIAGYTPAGVMLKAQEAIAPGGMERAGQVANELLTPQRPESSLGRALGSVGEGVVGAFTAPSAWAAKGLSAGIGAASGAGAEAADRATGGEGNWLSRMGGGVLAGGLAALVGKRVPTADSMVRDSTRAVSPEQWKQAREAEQVLKANQLPHLSSQLLGESSSLADVVNRASAHPKARPTLLEATQDVGDKASQTMNVWKERNLPVAVEERRGLLLDVQKAAKAKERELVGKSNEEFAAKLPQNEVYSGGYVQELKQQLVDLATRKYGETSPEGKAILRYVDEHFPAPIPGKPATAPTPTGVLDAQGKPYMTGGMPAVPPAQPGMEKAHLNNLVKSLNTLTYREDYKGLPTSDLKRVLKEFTPEFDQARAAKTAVMEGEVTPFRQGLAGDIARMGGGPNDSKYTVTRNVVGMVFPPDKAQPQAIRKLGQDVGAQEVGHLLREHLTTEMEKAAKGLGANRQTPANFVEAIAGTNAQRQNLDAALGLVALDSGANPTAVRKGFNELMHAFGTYQDLKIAPGVAGANIDFTAGRSLAGTAVAPNSRLGRFFWEAATAKTYQKIAEIVTSPEGVALLERIARTPDPKVKDTLLRAVLTSAVPGKSPDITTE